MNKLYMWATALISATCLAVVTAVAANNDVLGFNPVRAEPGFVNCGNYKTSFDWNISYDEVVGLTSFEEGYKTMDDNESDLLNCSSIIASATSTKGQYYRQEDNKLEVKSLKFGTSSAKGSLALTLTKQIDAIGFYAEAYQHAKDADGTKTLTVNGQTTAALGSTYDYSTCQRFFVEFEEQTNQVSIEASIASNNRFHIYSIGFYSKHNFPDAPVVAMHTVSFDANGGTGTMSPVQVQEGSSYTLPTCTFTAPSGYEFDYWSIGDTKQTEPITVNSDITLKANWKEKATPTGSEITFTQSELAVSEQTITKNPITLQNSSTYSGSVTELRIYKGQTLTITANSATIVSIEFTCTASGTTKYGPGCFKAQTGYSYSGKVGTWTGSASSIVFTASSNQVRITQIVVTYQ